MKWKCLIVDDEVIARKLMAEYISKVPELEVLATSSTAMGAMKYIRDNAVDILFLDIHMPDLTGLDFIKILPKKPSIIITTAFSEYAVESYDLQVTDYLLKPIDFDRFYQAVTRATGLLSRKSSFNQIETTTKLFVKSDKKIIKIDFDDIMLINAHGAYIEILTKEETKIMSLQSMSKLEDLLPSNFYRVHRSHIVNTDHILSIDGNQILIGSQKVIISKNKRDGFFALIDVDT